MNDVIQFQRPSDGFMAQQDMFGLGDGIAGSFTILTYKAKVWRLRHSGKDYAFGTPHVDVIFVGRSPHTSKQYYSSWNEADSNKVPVCASIKGDVPDNGVPEKQSDTCATCPHNEWGSAANGRGKACQDHKRLAVLLMPNVTVKMLGIALVDPVYLKVPPASFSAFKRYSDWLDQRQIPWNSVITRLEFSQDKLFEIIFHAEKALDKKWEPIILPMRESITVQRILGLGTKLIGGPATREPEQRAPVEDAGLYEVFSQGTVAAPAPAPAPAPASRRGRPRTVVPAPKTTLEGVPGPDVPPTQTAPPAAAPPPPPPPSKPKLVETAPPPEVTGETDAELDDGVAAMLARKVGGMLS